jgi:hypothetical protein
MISVFTRFPPASRLAPTPGWASGTGRETATHIVAAEVLLHPKHPTANISPYIGLGGTPVKNGAAWFLIVCTLTQIASGADRPHNIFDDDWAPRKSTEAPPRPTTAKSYVLPPASSRAKSKAPPTSKPADSVPPSPPAPKSVRRAIPTKSELAAVRATMRDVFAEQLTDVSIPGRRKLATALLAQADKSAELPVDQFVLLSAAIDAAVDAADLDFALQAADRMAKRFAVDGLGIKSEAVTSRGPKPPTPEAAAANVQAALELTNDLAAADDFATALRVCAAIQPAAASDATLRARVLQRQRELVLGREAADRFARDVEKLKASPDDPALNLAVGRYACFVKREWDGGLTFLAKGSDSGLKSLASEELAMSSTPDAIARVADAWWDAGAAARQGDAASRAAMAAHASDLYQRVVERMEGLRRQQVEKRIAQVAQANAPPVKPNELLPTMEGTHHTTNQGVVVLTGDDRISTTESYKTPVAFRIVAQTDSTNIRLAYAADEIVFNWEVNPRELRIDGGPAGGHHRAGAGLVPRNTWVTIDLVVARDLMTISVDGEQRHSISADFSRINQRLSIYPSHGSTVMVRSLQLGRPTQ